MYKYFIYRHIRTDKNEPFYIGKGTLCPEEKTLKWKYKRAYSIGLRNCIWRGIVSRTEYSVEIVFETNDVDILNVKEKEFILMYGRIDLNTGCLCNLTEGGDGVSSHTEESIKMAVDKRLKNGSYKTTGENNSRPVYAYSLDGKYLMAFPSNRACAKYIGVGVDSLFNAKRELKSAKGYLFSSEKHKVIPNLSLYKIKKYHQLSIVQKDEKGGIVNVFKNIPDAATKLHVKQNRISKNLQFGRPFFNFSFERMGTIELKKFQNGTSNS